MKSYDTWKATDPADEYDWDPPNENDGLPPDEDIVSRLTFIAKSRESDPNDDGHEIMEGVAEIQRLRAEVKTYKEKWGAIVRMWNDPGAQ